MTERDTDANASGPDDRAGQDRSREGSRDCVDPQWAVPSIDAPAGLGDSLVDVSVETTSWERSELLADVGPAIGPDRLTVGRIEVDSDWSALAIIEHLDEIFERTNPHTAAAHEPPALECTVVGDETVFVEFRSRTDSCSLFAGIVEAIGERYDDPLAVTHRSCDGRSDDSAGTLLVSTARHRTDATAGAGNEVGQTSH
ncbi:hypothetical protein [Halovivax cerinus]|uniref:Heme NO binding protein n=1 Tax=Halovivax cerinus TaxID=1487865 RepID=A0ABD5NPD7_9EURY|nr:hypothetical protein [Halovivax cerinus]